MILFPNCQVKETEEEKKDKALIPKTEDVKLEAKLEEEDEEESKEKAKRQKKRRLAKKS